MIMDVFGIGQAIWNLLFDIFVRGPLYVVNGLGDAITYLSGQKIIDLVFGSTGHFLNMPPQFLTFLAIAISLIILFGGCVILHAMVNKEMGSTLSSLANRVLMILLLLILIPLFFWIINFTVISIIKIIMPQLIDGLTLADMVGRLGFTDGGKHLDWNYNDGYPDWNNYNLFLGTFGSFFCLVIFFLMGLSLIKRLFDLFLLYIVSPVVFSTAASNAKWQKVSIWKDLVIGRFVSTLGIVLTLTLFMNLEPLMLSAADQVSDSWAGQTAFKLLFIAGGAISSYQAQILFSTLVGTTVGITDGIGMLISMKAATSGVKAGTLGMLGVGKGLLVGKKTFIQSASQTKSLTSGAIGALGSGTLSRTASFATKATVGTLLSTAGFIAGTKRSIQTHGVKDGSKLVGKQIIKPVTSIGKVIKDKTATAYNSGLNKHNASKHFKASKALEKSIKKTKLKEKNNYG